MKLKTTIKTKPSLSVVLGPFVSLLEKPTESLLEQLEEEAQKNRCITHFVRRKPRFFFSEEIPQREIPFSQSQWESIMNQLKLELDEEELEVALAILHQLDHRGFFVGDEAQIAKEFGISKEFVEDLREFIMTELEPVGIASKGYEEFFCVQLRELYPEEKDLCQKVLEFLKTGVGDQRIKDIATRLRLTPFEGEQSPYKVGSVDVILERDQDGWLVLLMEDFIDFEVQEGEREEKERALRWKRLLNLRRKLLRGCINLVVERQEDFLLGVGPLKALELTEVAQKLGVSVSVISRLVSNKYVKTPTGIYPLRFFFQRRSKGGYSGEQVLRAMKEILQKHGKLSDAKVAELLKEKGIELSRRTVCKYRRML